MWNCVLQLWFSCLWRNRVNGRKSVSTYQIRNIFNVKIKIRTMSTVLTYEFHNVLIWYAWLWDLFVNSHSLRIRLHPVGFYNKGFLLSNIFRLCNDEMTKTWLCDVSLWDVHKPTSKTIIGHLKQTCPPKTERDLSMIYHWQQ